MPGFPMETKDLTQLGLLESESKTYFALLAIGQCSAGKIAKESKLNRVSVYKALFKLTDLGLVSYTIKANKKEYSASNPISIKKLIEEKQNQLNTLLTNLSIFSSNYHANKNKVEVNIYEGIKGAKTVWESILEECKPQDTWFVLGAPKSAEILGGYFKDFNKRRAQRRVKMNIIYNQDAQELIKIRKSQSLTKVKVLPKEYITPTSIEIINNNVLIVLYSPLIFIFSIKNKEVASSFKQYFALLWKLAKS